MDPSLSSVLTASPTAAPPASTSTMLSDAWSGAQLEPSWGPLPGLSHLSGSGLTGLLPVPVHSPSPRAAALASPPEGPAVPSKAPQAEDSTPLLDLRGSAHVPVGSGMSPRLLGGGRSTASLDLAGSNSVLVVLTQFLSITGGLVSPACNATCVVVRHLLTKQPSSALVMGGGSWEW